MSKTLRTYFPPRDMIVVSAENMPRLVRKGEYIYLAAEVEEVLKEIAALRAQVARVTRLEEALTYLERELRVGALTLFNQKAILKCDRDWILNQADKAQQALRKDGGG